MAVIHGGTHPNHWTKSWDLILQVAQAVAVHGTSYVNVIGNVAFDIVGHMCGAVDAGVLTEGGWHDVEMCLFS